MSQDILTDNEFVTFAKNLKLNDEVILSIKKSGYFTPTRMQLLAIPSILEGNDVMIQAQTGSGKTACFIFPMLHMIKHGNTHPIQVLVLSPTRELALQIVDSFKKLSQGFFDKIKIMSIIGGERFVEQEEKIQNGVNIVVATPGRLIDLLEKKLLNLKELKYLVLDEADKLLDQSFATELDNLLNDFSSHRQNIFVSATYPEKINSIVSKISNKPKHLRIEESLVVERINQRCILVNKEKKSALLRHIIKNENLSNGIIFVGSQTLARNLSEKLNRDGFKVSAIYGDLTQNERNKALSDLKNKKVNFLVATDIAARGIDIEKLDIVINYDLPRSPLDYVHRIGRTARVEESGQAITFVGHEDVDHFKLIEKKTNISLNREQIIGFELTGNAIVKQRGQAPIKGKRKSKKDKLRELNNK